MIAGDVDREPFSFEPCVPARPAADPRVIGRLADVVRHDAEAPAQILGEQFRGVAARAARIGIAFGLPRSLPGGVDYVAEVSCGR